MAARKAPGKHHVSSGKKAVSSEQFNPPDYKRAVAEVLTHLATTPGALERYNNNPGEFLHALGVSSRLTADALTDLELMVYLLSDSFMRITNTLVIYGGCRPGYPCPPPGGSDDVPPDSAPVD